MNIRKFILLIAAVLFTSAQAMPSEKCTELNGNMNAGKVTINCLKATGAISLKGTTIQNALKVSGSLTATAVHLDSLDISGSTVFHASEISGPVQIRGSLEAFDTSFKNKIQISSKSATFNHSFTHSIEIKSTQPAFIYLNDNSMVVGDIIFVNGKGTVKNNHSKITGKVIGGEISE